MTLLMKLATSGALLMGALSAMAQSRPMTTQDVDLAVRSNELILSVKFTPAQRTRIARALEQEWNQPGSNLPAMMDQLRDGMNQLMRLPQRTRELALRSNVIGFLERMDESAKGGDVISQVCKEAYLAAHPALNPKAPLFSAMIADAYVDAYLFLGEIQSNKPAPSPSAALRSRLRKEVAADYARMNNQQRGQMTQVMQRVTSFMIQWPEMPAYERLLVRAECGARLTAQEQQMVAQIRQQMSAHNNQMIANELNFMRQSQQTIMGSAPYWNPAANRWEQKGGVITEFQ